MNRLGHEHLHGFAQKHNVRLLPFKVQQASWRDRSYSYETMRLNIKVRVKLYSRENKCYTSSEELEITVGKNDHEMKTS